MCEEPSLFTESYPRARRPHQCCECLRRIEPGEHYYCASGRWDGDFLRFKSCWQCQSMRLYLKREASKFWREPWCIAFGHLKEEWREYFGAPLGQCSLEQAVQP